MKDEIAEMLGITSDTSAPASAGIVCPSCGGAVRKAGAGVGAGAMFGLIGALFVEAFASCRCSKCGPITSGAFPKDARQEILVERIMLGAGALLIFLVLLLFIGGRNR
jgi:hypothetical protein